MSDSVRPHRQQPTKLTCPWDSPGRTLEWVAISFSNAWKWKMKVKSLSLVRLFATPWTATYQAPPSTGFSINLTLTPVRVLEWVAIAFSRILANWLQMINLIYECSYAIFWVRLHIYIISARIHILAASCSLWDLSSSTSNWTEVTA